MPTERDEPFIGGRPRNEAWKLINMKVPHEQLRRIDKAAHERGLTRTAYMVGCADPQSEMQPNVLRDGAGGEVVSGNASAAPSGPTARRRDA